MLAGTLPAIEQPEPGLTLPDFIAARYSDDEDHHRCICLEFGSCGGQWCSPGCPTCSDGEQAPRRVQAIAALDEIAAKRAILEMHTPDRAAADPWARTVDPACTSYSYGDHTIVYENECQTLQILAWPFRGHPDYDPAWGRYLPGSLTGETDDEDASS